MSFPEWMRETKALAANRIAELAKAENAGKRFAFESSRNQVAYLMSRRDLDEYERFLIVRALGVMDALCGRAPQVEGEDA